VANSVTMKSQMRKSWGRQ